MVGAVRPLGGVGGTEKEKSPGDLLQIEGEILTSHVGGWDAGDDVLRAHDFGGGPGGLSAAYYLALMGHEVTVYEKRKQLLEAIRYVDLVIPEESWEQKRSDIREYHVDTFVMGDDWQGKFDFLQDLCQVVYLPRTPEISTTQIKKDLEK